MWISLSQPEKCIYYMRWRWVCGAKRCRWQQVHFFTSQTAHMFFFHSLCEVAINSAGAEHLNGFSVSLLCMESILLLSELANKQVRCSFKQLVWVAVVNWSFLQSEGLNDCWILCHKFICTPWHRGKRETSWEKIFWVLISFHFFRFTRNNGSVIKISRGFLRKNSKFKLRKTGKWNFSWGLFTGLTRVF